MRFLKNLGNSANVLWTALANRDGLIPCSLLLGHGVKLVHVSIVHDTVQAGHRYIRRETDRLMSQKKKNK